jgi:hypothetical protein
MTNTVFDEYSGTSMCGVVWVTGKVCIIMGYLEVRSVSKVSFTYQ